MEELNVGEKINAVWDSVVAGCLKTPAPAEPPYQQRMRVELQELVTRLDALRAFLMDPVRRTKVQQAERELMFTQLNAMTVYREALASRMRLIGMEV